MAYVLDLPVSLPASWSDSLPSPHFWFTGSAFFTIGSFALFAILGFAGIASMSGRFRAWLIVGYCLAVGLFMVGWHTAANQERDNAELKQSIQHIATVLGIDPKNKPPIIAEEIVQKEKRQKIAMARRWIRLADDIQTDASTANFVPPTYLPGLTPEQRQTLWQQETQRSIADFNAQIARLKTKYAGRLAQARDEMQTNNINLAVGMAAPDGTIVLVNSFSFERWAQKLSAEGRKILTENDESAD